MLNGGVQLCWILIFGFKAIRNGSAHGLFPNGHRRPVAAFTVLPVTGKKQGIGYIQFAFKGQRSEEHTSELQSRGHLVCRLLLEKKKRYRECEMFALIRV